MAAQKANPDATIQFPERLWQLSSDLMAVADRDGRILASNNAWRVVLGRDRKDLAHHDVLSFVHPEDRAETAREFARLSSGRPTERFENRMQRRDGEYRRISWRASPAEEGHFYAVGRDITERLQREEAARHAQKMEAIGQLTGGIAHDFNNLLTIVRSSLDFLQRPDLPEDRRRRYLSAVSEAVDRATKLTSQLLAFARRQKLEPEVFDVGERIADVSELLRQLVGPRIIVDTAVSGPCRVEADLCQFETALMNLAINARDAMDNEGRLTIEAREVEGVPPIRGHAPASGSFVAISVRDTGHGISAEQLGRVFDPFFTTKAAGKGTGLGLSQVYGFVKQSGGNVDVESRPGAGARFTIYLPGTDRPADPPAEASAEKAERAGPWRKGLLVEDNEEVGEFCLGLLRDLGYDTTWARNADEALRLIDAAPHVDFVFSDVVMPGMSGIEFAERLRARRPDLPILLTSGYSSVLAQEGSRGFPLLSKPYSAAELAEALRRLLGPGARDA